MSSPQATSSSPGSPPRCQQLPAGKQFAFTIVDDTDHATIERVGPVYKLLAELGLRTTKTLWTNEPTLPSPYDGSSTAADPSYRRFLQDLKADGFELALHGVTMHSSKRTEIEQGLAWYREWFGAMPRCHINHFKNADNIYWGRARLSNPASRLIHAVASREPASQGHVQGSEYFWGDICQRHISYVRSFTYRETNLLRLGLPLVYADTQRPYAKRMFISTEGGELDSYLDAVGEEKQDQLSSEGGVCILYTHFGAGFVEHGQLNPRFELLMRRLAALDGWFVPASELLDALCQGGCANVSSKQRRELEFQWMRGRLRHGSS
ncbi:MAG: hypothetical protein JHC87_03575 [Thermoleophilaceae bacterium]|nr:hypothetical protein [Thermoleophilaceae bacterium]